MRKLYLLLVFCVGFLFTNTAYSQNNFWTFPEEYWDPFTLTTQSLPTGNYNGAPSDYTHAGIMDPYGEIVFSKIDDQAYDKNGLNVGYFGAGANTYIAGTGEALIVPQPGSCERFYIFQTGKDIYDEAPFYSIYNHDLNHLESLNTGNTAIRMDDGVLIENWSFAKHSIKGVYFAATKERADSTRWVFIANNKDLYRVDLKCSGLSGTHWKYEYTAGLPGEYDLENGWRSEMEIYEDTAKNTIRVAIPIQKDVGSNKVNVALFDLDSITGNVIPASYQVISLTNNANGAATWVHGLEFSPDGNLLYILHEKSSAYTSLLGYYDIANQTLTDLNYTNIQNFKYSELQVAGDSANYTLWIASEDYLGSLLHPDNPSPSNWVSNAIPLNNYPTNLGGSPSYFTADIKHIVPDQIDYDDYVENVFFASCDCCEKYAYAGSTKETVYTATTSATWSYGLSNNPWHAVQGDTIYIRDQLIIPAGISITISGMYFKFGPDASALVKRTDGQNEPGRLVLDNGTVFTADFRCARRKYHCDDPNAGCNHLEFWQGVRVEGDATDVSQSGHTQAYFAMRNNSMVEYAKIGILAGSESLSNYGGGIISIIDSRLKDNLTGIKFDPYSRLNGSTEMYKPEFNYYSEIQIFINVDIQISFSKSRWFGTG